MRFLTISGKSSNVSCRARRMIAANDNFFIFDSLASDTDSTGEAAISAFHRAVAA